MRKLTSLFLALVVAMALLSACGGGSDAGASAEAPSKTPVSKAGETSEAMPQAAGGTLTIWVEKSFSDDANAAMENRIQQYADETGIVIQSEFIAATDLMTKLNAAVEANAVPDITTGGPYKVLSYYPNNPYMDITDLVDEVHAERPFIESVREGTKLEGKNYFVPAYNSTNLLFVRADLFEAANVEIPSTWDELFDAAAKVSDPEHGVYGLGMGCGPTDEDCENTFRMINWSNGGRIWNADGSVAAATDPVTRATLEKYVELYNEGVIPPSATTWDPGGNNKSYLMGESAMVINAPTLYNALQDEEYKTLAENTVVVNLPDGDVDNVVLGIPMGWSIMEGSSNVEGARDFIKYMCDPDWYDSYMEQVVPVFAPVFEDCINNPLWSDGINKQTVEYVQNATGYYGYPAEPIESRAVASKNYFSFPIARMLNSVVVGEKNAEEALAQLESEINDTKASVQ